MDQRRGDIAQDVRAVMETRNAIGEKLELLERRVQDTVEGAKLSVEEVIDRVKDAADDLLDKTKQRFDPSYQVQQHPWMMVGGAIVAGYVLGLLEARAVSQAREPGVYPYYPPDRTEGAPVMSQGGPSPVSNVWEGISRELSAEIDHAKQALVEAGRAFIHEFFQQALPAIGHSLGLTPGGGTTGRSHRGNGDRSPNA
ncbi:DUF883 family protein [Candidatus Nitrospira bockiana]